MVDSDRDIVLVTPFNSGIVVPIRNSKVSVSPAYMDDKLATRTTGPKNR